MQENAPMASEKSRPVRDMLTEELDMLKKEGGAARAN